MVRDTADANTRAVAMLALARPSTVLEIGFGPGRTAAVLVDQGHQVPGVDASQTMVQQATAHNRVACRNGRATLRHGDGITISFPDNSADVGFTVHTVYFMTEPAVTFADIARVLRPGGTLVIACRTSDTPIPSWMDPDIYRIPTAAQLTAMLLDAAYETVAHDSPDSSAPDLHLFAAHLPDRSVSS